MAQVKVEHERRWSSERGCWYHSILGIVVVGDHPEQVGERAAFEFYSDLAEPTEDWWQDAMKAISKSIGL